MEKPFTSDQADCDCINCHIRSDDCRYWNQLQQANQLDQKIEKAKAEKEFAEKQKESLTQQVELLQNDEYIAKLARSEYYLSKNGEIIFSTPNDTAENKAQQVKEEVEQGETVVKVTTQNR